MNQIAYFTKMIPTISLDLFLSFFGIESARESSLTFADIPYYSRSLTGAIWGYDDIAKINSASQVNMGRVLLRDKSAFKDLSQLMLSPLLAVTIVFLAMNMMSSSSSQESIDVAVQSTTNIDLFNVQVSRVSIENACTYFLSEFVSSAAVLLFGYVFLAIPLVRIIIHERDDQLARGVAAACQQVCANTEQKQNDAQERLGNMNKRVVAVLGLLHVNGVTERLLKDTKQNNDKF